MQNLILIPTAQGSITLLDRLRRKQELRWSLFRQGKERNNVERSMDSRMRNMFNEVVVYVLFCLLIMMTSTRKGQSF